MQDRFKFRGMNKDKWYYGGYFKHLPYTPQPIRYSEVPEKDYKHLIIQDSFSDWGLPRNMTCIEVEPETVGQCTGLKDKNGELIFEGDIAINEGTVCVINWDNDKCAFFGETASEYFAFEEDITIEDFEIIGNIYENPELLER